MAWIEAAVNARGGEVSFRDYMELALYHPENGYYTSPEPRYGRAGDFLTAPTASRWYGSVLAVLCGRLAAEVGPLSFVDLAAGDGSLVDSLLQRSTIEQNPAVRQVVTVERSQTMRDRQQQLLAGSVVDLQIESEIGELDLGPGPRLVHASELYDALPVHRVQVRSGELVAQTVRVGEHGGLEWAERAIGVEVASYLQQHGVSLVEGQTAECNLEAAKLHRRVLGWIGRPGLAVILDYGYEARRLYDPRGRLHGSLACYQRHQLSRDPLAEPGSQDITAHVNWGDLRSAAEGAGWHEVGLWSLAEFLIRAGLEEEMTKTIGGIEAELTAEVVSARQEIKRLLDPDGMGADLKVLVQVTPELAEAAERALQLP